MELLIQIGGFILCAAVIFMAGRRLSYYADMFAAKTGLGKAWVGLILLSAVTTLPELMTGISAAAIVRSPDLAVGNVLGSCAFNLGILSLMDAFTPKDAPLLGKASQSHVLAAAMGSVLVAMVGLGLFLETDILLTPSIGLTSLSFAAIYFVAVRLIYQFNKTNPTTNPTNAEPIPHSMAYILWGYILFGLIIVVTALLLPYFADNIATQTELGKSFIGTLLLAGSTSLPEVAVSVAAVRMGSIDLSIGNILGSNIFNVFILFIAEISYDGHILKEAHNINIVSVFAVIIMYAVAIVGLTYRATDKRYLLAWDTLIILLLYIANMYMLYKL